MRDSAWNTPFGRLLIVASVLSAIGGCVYASSLVRDEQNATAALQNVDENLTTTDMNATEMNAVAMNATVDDGAASGQAQDQPDEQTSTAADDGQYMNATDMNATDMNDTDAQ